MRTPTRTAPHRRRPALPLTAAAAAALALLAATAPGPTASLPAAAAREASPSSELYPPIEPFRTGFLKVSPLHELYYELSGNPQGTPVFVLHGGPGGGSAPDQRRFHDPKKWLIVLFDQRGCGKSRPALELRDNNTQALVEDIERLRKHLHIDKLHVFGGSWGSTLGLAYAEAHRDRVLSLVLRGIFLGDRDEVDYFYHGGAAAFYPDAYAKLQAELPHPEQKDYPRQLLTLLQGKDAAVRERVARAWARYEIKLAYLAITEDKVEAALTGWDPKSLAFIESHYMVNGCFLKEGQLLSGAAALAGIPTVIVQGRHDVICRPSVAYNLHRRIPGSQLVLVEEAGHTAGSEPMRAALVKAVHAIETGAPAAAPGPGSAPAAPAKAPPK